MGINHSLEHLTTIQNRIHTLPIEEQAAYADIICRNSTNNIEFCQKTDFKEEEFPIWNTTSVGNVAYIALNAPTQELKDKYREGLTKYCEWRRNFSQ